MPTNHLPTILAHIENRVNEIKDNKVQISDDLSRLRELQLVLNLVRALQQQDEASAGLLAKAGL